MFLRINGRTHYLWRALDQDGDVLDILVQSRRNKKAATRFFRKLLKGLQYVPRVIVMDQLRSYSAAKAEIMPSVEHHQHKGCNNRAENLHQPTRLREKVMRRFSQWLSGSNEVEICRMERGVSRSDSSLTQMIKWLIS